MSCSLDCLFQLFFQIFTLFGFIVYILTLIVLLKKRKDDLKSSFFKLFTSVGVADVLWITQTIIVRNVAVLLWNYFPSTRMVIESVWFMTIKTSFEWSFYYAQVFGVLMLSINRLTSIMRLGEVENIWNTKILTMAILFQWAWIFPFSLPMFHPCCRSEMVSNVSLHSKFQSDEAFYMFWTADVVLEVCVIAPILIVIHATMFVKVLKYKPTVAPAASTNQNQPTNMSSELRFAIMGTVLCSSYICMVSNWGIVWLHGDYVNWIHSLYSTTTQLIFTLANPFLLFIFSTKFRSNFIEIIFRKKTEQIVVQAAQPGVKPRVHVPKV